jgi:hypothetical protein
VAQLFPPGFSLAPRSVHSSSSSASLFHRLFMTGMDSVDPHRDDDDATSCAILWLNAQQQQQQQSRQTAKQQVKQQTKARQQQQPGNSSTSMQGNKQSSLQQPKPLPRPGPCVQEQQQTAALEQSLFGLWPLLTAVQPDHGSACYLPSQHIVHGTSYPRHAAEHQAALQDVLHGRSLLDAAQPPAAAAAAVDQPGLQRYGIALVNKRRDVACVLRQWHAAVAALRDVRLDEQGKRQVLQQQLTWLCMHYSRELLGMQCQVPTCTQLWSPLLQGCGDP